MRGQSCFAESGEDRPPLTMIRFHISTSTSRILIPVLAYVKMLSIHRIVAPIDMYSGVYEDVLGGRVGAIWEVFAVEGDRGRDGVSVEH